MTETFGDRLDRAVQAKGTPACVGIDPVREKLPAIFRKEGIDTAAGAAKAFELFGKGVIDAVADLVPVVKLNIAFFEPLHGAGIAAYDRLIAYGRSKDILVIADVKRADIGHTSAAYAEAYLSEPRYSDIEEAILPDAITINPYFGIDGVKPFLDACRDTGRGVFVLVHTSNPSAKQIQGITGQNGETVADAVAQLVGKWSDLASPDNPEGYSAVGAVVAPEEVETAQRLRSCMPRSFFLVPGFGAQGRSVDQVRACFKTAGTGAIVNSSRGVIFAGDTDAPDTAAWGEQVRSACQTFIEQLKAVER